MYGMVYGPTHCLPLGLLLSGVRGTFHTHSRIETELPGSDVELLDSSGRDCDDHQSGRDCWHSLPVQKGLPPSDLFFETGVVRLGTPGRPQHLVDIFFVGGVAVWMQLCGQEVHDFFAGPAGGDPTPRQP